MGVCALKYSSMLELTQKFYNEKSEKKNKVVAEKDI